VVRLANRRFLAFHFDLNPFSPGGDLDAKAFVVRNRPDLAGFAVDPVGALIMTPSGEVLAEIDAFATAEELLQAMRDVLLRWPEIAGPFPTEAAPPSAIEAAEARIDLGDRRGAREILARDGSPRACLLLGKLARLEHDWEAMEAELKRVTDPALAVEVRMERAYRLWHTQEFEALARYLEGFPQDSPRYAEARYHEGLALYHVGKRKSALEVWRSMVRSLPQGPWVYRADWAYTTAIEGERREFSALGKRTSVLRRVGYPVENPDVTRPGGEPLRRF